MSLTETKKSPLIALPFLKKRLRRINALGLRNLTVKEFNFSLYFSLHRNDKTVAFYTSEPIENQRSPEWSYLKFPTNVQCLQDFVIRLWIVSSNTSRLFLECDVHLDSSLVPDEQKDESQESNNSLWLEMFGYRFTDNYQSLDDHRSDLPPVDLATILTEKRFSSKRSLIPKSYNEMSIRRMMNLIQAIRSEKQASTGYLERLQAFFDANEEYLAKIKEREFRQFRTENLKEYLQSHMSAHERRVNAYQQRVRSVDERRYRLQQNLEKLFRQQAGLTSLFDQLNQAKYLLHDLKQLNVFRQKHIISEIYRHMYPILSDSKTEYSIASLKLPPAEDRVYQTSFKGDREKEITAAAGYSAHLVLLISQFMQLPLRFPIECYGAPMVKMYNLAVRTADFPLDPNSDGNNFQYGLFLLNRNIGQIMYHCRVGDRDTDYRNTLENLKELMEKYFLQPMSNNQIQLHASDQHSIDTSVLASSSSNSSIERLTVQHRKRNSTTTSLFSSFRSSASSLVDNHPLGPHANDDNGIELYAAANTISPRLTMQYSHQPQP